MVYAQWSGGRRWSNLLKPEKRVEENPKKFSKWNMQISWTNLGRDHWIRNQGKLQLDWKLPAVPPPPKRRLERSGVAPIFKHTHKKKKKTWREILVLWLLLKCSNEVKKKMANSQWIGGRCEQQIYWPKPNLHAEGTKDELCRLLKLRTRQMGNERLNGIEGPLNGIRGIYYWTGSFLQYMSNLWS